MHRHLILAGLLGLTVACTPEKLSEPEPDTSSEEAVQKTSLTESTEVHDKEAQNAVSKLQWVQQFNLKKEIGRALSEKDFRLFVIAKRGPNVPGIDLNKQTLLKKRCGEKYLQGVGDVLFGEAHKALYDKAIKLASEYNRIVADNCERSTIHQ